MRIRRATTNERSRRHCGVRRLRLGVPMNVKRGPVMVLGVIVIVVQVDVQQRQRPVAEDQDDTGENRGDPLHGARVYPSWQTRGSAAPEQQ